MAVIYSFNNGQEQGSWNTFSDLLSVRYKFYSITQITLSGNFEDSNISFNDLFVGCQNLTSVDFSNLDTSNVTDMSGMFTSCPALTNVDLSNLDTSNVTDMSTMFNFCPALTSLDISSFDTSNVTDMSEMFRVCQNLEHIYVGEGWNVSNVTNSSDMFLSCVKLPNYSYSFVDKTKAHYENGGYLELLELRYLIQLKHQNEKAFPKVFCDERTITQTNGKLSAKNATVNQAGIVLPDNDTIKIDYLGRLFASPHYATTLLPGIVKPDGTTINVSADGTISAVGGSDITLAVKGVI